MKYRIFKRAINISCVLFGLLSAGTFFLLVGGGGVLNDLDGALIEMRDLEERGLLENPPEGTSKITRREIALVKNTATLEKYIQETEVAQAELMVWMKGFVILFLLLLLFRIFAKPICRFIKIEV